MDSIGDSPTAQSQTSCLTEEEARKLLEGLTKRSRSAVWTHYERYIHFSGSSYSIRAKCVYCLKADYACDTTANGTKSLNNHVERCKEYPPNKINIDAKQKVLSFDNPSKIVVGFDQKEITKVCVKMIVMDELPFTFVEGQGFREFCSIACPLWKVPCRQTIARDVLSMYYIY